jgi:hypothetical protein
MKNKKQLQRISVILASLLTLALFHLVGSGCTNPLEWVSDSKSVAVSGGGELTSFIERESSGSASGNDWIYKYRVYADYTGTQRVEEIKTEWTVFTDFYQKSTAYTAQLQVPGRNQIYSATKVIQAGSSYLSGPNLTLNITNTNGVKRASWESNTFTMTPGASAALGRVQNIATLRIAGHSSPAPVILTV